MGCPTGHHPRTNRVVMSRVATSSRWTLHSKKKTKTPTMSPRENDDDSWRASDGNFEHQATAVDQMEAATPQRDEAGVGDATETSSGTNQQSVVEAMDDLALTEVKFFQGDRCMYVAEQGGEEGVQNGGGGNIFALAESAVKARVTSVGSSNYRLALPDGSEVTVPLAHPGLYTIGEYESLRLEGETAAMGIVASGPYGGGGGTPFDDMEVYRGDADIAELSVYHGKRVVDGITVSYSGSSGNLHGTSPGGSHTVVLKAGEYIVEATVKYGKFVHSLAFRTNLGRDFGPWGGGDGVHLGLSTSLVSLALSEVCVKAPDRYYALSALYGRAGRYLDAIGFYWAPTATRNHSARKEDITTALAKEVCLKRSDVYGCGRCDGVAFNDGHYNIRITDLTIVTTRGGSIRGVSAHYYTGQSVSHGGRPKAGKTDEMRLDLAKGEWIVEVHVRHNDKSIVALTFVTNKDRSLGPCGKVSEKDGDGWDGCRDSVATAPTGYMLIGFTGNAGEKSIHNMGFNWSPAPKGH